MFGLSVSHRVYSLGTEARVGLTAPPSASHALPFQTDAFLFTLRTDGNQTLGGGVLFLVLLRDFAFSLAKRKMRLWTVHNYAGLLWHSLYWQIYFLQVLNGNSIYILRESVTSSEASALGSFSSPWSILNN